MSQVASVEVARTLRAERVAALRRQLRAGDFDAARYESTPRRRAERLAQILVRSLSCGAMRRRLKSLGVSPQFCGGTLQAISVEGGGLDVRRADGQGQVLTGPGLDERILQVFPELVPFTLRNLTLSAAQSVSADNGVDVWNPGDPDPDNMSGSGVEAYNLTLFLASYTATAAKSLVDLGRTSVIPFGSDQITSATATSTYYTASLGAFLTLQPWNLGYHYVPGQTFAGSPYGVNWPSDGINWVNTHAEQSDAVVGATSWTATYNAVGFQAYLGLVFQTLVITYTNTGCDTCSLTIQVNSECDGELVTGGVFDLGNGLSCTQGADGSCTISNIPHGSYNWTWEKTDWDTQTGTFVCDCAGGPSTLFIDALPEGGCGGTANVQTEIINFCTGLPLAGVLIVLDEGTPDEQSCTTDGTGICEFTGVEAGSHTLTVTLADYQIQTRTFATTGGAGVEEVTIRVALVPDGGCADGLDCRDDLTFLDLQDQGLVFLEHNASEVTFGAEWDGGMLFLPVDHRT